MLEKAKELMKKYKCDFIATGEVLGQRPMSQYKQALLNIEKEAKLGGRILRPLSAKLLPETQAQKKKLIDITKFPSIIGRARNIQIELAKRFNIKFPSPAGGCLLCDKNYSSKLKDIIENKKLENEKILPEDIQLLSIGRHFRSCGKIVLGRNEAENLKLEQLNKKIGFELIIPSKPGPTAIFQNIKDKNLAEKLIEAYSSKDLTKREQFNNIKIG
jgi:tRNA U34 2-thiouridine synthase MnmA/TrmU